MERLPNLFESYDQPENKLTFSLLQTLTCDDRLVRAFLRWSIPGLSIPRGAVSVYSQRKPAGGKGFRGGDPELYPTRPDGWRAIDDLVVALEVKRHPNSLDENQLKGHIRALAHKDARSRALLVLTPEKFKPDILDKLEKWDTKAGISICWRGWQDVHRWACEQISRADQSARKRTQLNTYFLRYFREYIEMSELSGFAGVTFDEGYDYRRAKAILKALREDLAGDLRNLYPALAHGRERITDDEKLVWDVFTESKNITRYPHFTLSIQGDGAYLSLTVPDKAGSAWHTLSRLARERRVLGQALKDFLRNVLRVPVPLRPIVQFNFMQRHWLSRSSQPIMDARLITRLDTATICPSALRAKGVQKQERWYGTVLNLFAEGKKGANWEFQIQTYFDTTQEITRTSALKDEMVRVLEAFKPLYKLVSTSS